MTEAFARDHQRALSQVWLPGFTEDGVIALSCQGAPYAISGEGDLCALFRCVSSRYIFYPTSPDPNKRGSIGRVFRSHKAEICSNIASAPAEVYHRADAARRCLLHTLCVIPLWIPAVSARAPVAVLEILQPDTQPDFDHLHVLAGQALKAIDITKVSVTAPVPDLLDTIAASSAAAPVAAGSQRRRARPPVRQYTAGLIGAAPPAPEERVMFVFEEQQGTDNGADHMAQVASRMADLPDARLVHDQGHPLTVEALHRASRKPSISPQSSPNVAPPPPQPQLQPHHPRRAEAVAATAAPLERADSESMRSASVASVSQDAAASGSSGGGGGGVAAAAAHGVGDSASAMHTSAHLAGHNKERNNISKGPAVCVQDGAEGSGHGGRNFHRGLDGADCVTSAYDAAVTGAAGSSDGLGQGQALGAREGSLGGATGKPASHAGVADDIEAHDMRGRGTAELTETIEAIELLQVVQDDEEWQHGERAGGSLTGGAAALYTMINSPANAAVAGSGSGGHSGGSSRKRRALARAGGDAAVAGAAATDAAAAPVGAPEGNRLSFGYPGGGTFMRVPAAPAEALAATAGPSLHSKLAVAEGRHAFSQPPPLPRRGSAPGAPVPAALGAPLPVLGVPVPATATADPLGGPPPPPEAAGGDAADARADDDDPKALRNRLNRVDGGIGRKLTLETLQVHFGKGLKEAAEDLGMCPTTLKRACRRLGVRRWPRTADAAAAILREARAHAAAQACGAAGAAHGQGLGGAGLHRQHPGAAVDAAGGVDAGLLLEDAHMGNFEDFLDLLESDQALEGRDGVLAA